ncbi:MAG: hypothetical protein R3263_08380, partial [Myxococcota bacterium]|nr:hypothetical protein [Myxococcota bacterium]
FTRPEARGAGVARVVLEAACRAAAGRGMPLGLLFAGPVAWYEAQGWRAWTLTRHRAHGARAPGDAGRVRRFEPARDLAALRDLHRATSSRLEGTVLRDDALWTASLRNAGNPDEDLLLAGDARGALRAYGRATRLGGARLVTEWGLDPEPGAEEALANVLAALLPEGGVIPNLARAPASLPAALRAGGVGLEAVRESFTMLRALDPADLAARLGVAPPAPDADSGAWLARRLPPERWSFWPADRF